MNLEQFIITRYTDNDKIKKGYYLRIRKEDGKLQIKIYYHGIEMMEWNASGLTVNTAVFLPNRSNVFEKGKLCEQYRTIPSIVKQDMETIESYFAFSIGTAARKEKRKGKKLDIYFSTGTLKHSKEELKNDIVRQFQETNIMPYFQENGIVLGNDQKRILLFLKNEMVTLQELYSFMIPLLEITLPNAELQKVEIEVKSKLKKEKIDFDQIESVLERRIDVYINQDETRQNDYKNSKSENNQEKQKQQDLMVLLNHQNKQDIFYKTKEGQQQLLYSKKTIPFELEYVVYAGNHKPEQKRSQNNVKGRIDNVVLDGNQLHFIEIKYGTGVIAESNGIHKHLIDLYSCFHISKDIILEELKERIKIRNEVLTNRKQEVTIDSTIYYDIVCIYDSKSSDKTLSKVGVVQKLCDIYEKNAKDPSVRCIIENDKLTLASPLENNDPNRYAALLLEKRIDDLCMMIERQGCQVRILLVDEEFQTFEEFYPKMHVKR